MTSKNKFKRPTDKKKDAGNANCVSWSLILFFFSFAVHLTRYYKKSNRLQVTKFTDFKYTQIYGVIYRFRPDKIYF